MKAEEQSNPPQEPPALIELQALVARAKQGDAAALPELRNLLDAHPEIWETVGDAGRAVQAAWIELLAGEDPLLRESLKRKANAMRADLCGEHPTQTEKMLAELAVNCWLAVQQAEHGQATQTGTGASAMQVSMRLKRCESANRRFLATIKVLTTLRSAMPSGLAPPNSLRIFGAERKPA